jgi:ABC-type transporter MlaC component
MNIFNFFKRKQTLLTVNSNENAILFTIDKNNKLAIRISAQLLNEKDAQKMAEVLFLLGKDYYRPSIVGMLDSMADEDESRKEFIESLASFWQMYLDTYKNENYNIEGDDPVISPTKFSQLVTNVEK